VLPPVPPCALERLFPAADKFDIVLALRLSFWGRAETQPAPRDAIEVGARFAARRGAEPCQTISEQRRDALFYYEAARPIAPRRDRDKKALPQ
jgi:hypothetical protein